MQRFARAAFSISNFIFFVASRRQFSQFLISTFLRRFAQAVFSISNFKKCFGASRGYFSQFQISKNYSALRTESGSFDFGISIIVDAKTNACSRIVRARFQVSVFWITVSCKRRYDFLSSSRHRFQAQFPAHFCAHFQRHRPLMSPCVCEILARKSVPNLGPCLGFKNWSAVRHPENS